MRLPRGVDEVHGRVGAGMVCQQTAENVTDVGHLFVGIGRGIFGHPGFGAVDMNARRERFGLVHKIPDRGDLGNIIGICPKLPGLKEERFSDFVVTAVTAVLSLPNHGR